MSGITFGTPSDAEILEMALDKRERNTAKSIPGIVISYNASARTCSVQPAVHRLLPSADDSDVDETEPLPALQDVPVAWPAGRGFRFKGSLQKGDSVLLVAMDRDIDAWRRSGAVSEPDDARMNSWGSAIAIPGLEPDSGSYGTDPTDAAALASRLDALLKLLTGGWVPVPMDGGLALQTAVKRAFPGFGTGGIPTPQSGSTTASDVLLLQS